MFEFMQDMGNYDERVVGRKETKTGITVSTAYTSDEGYETALIDKEDVHPVERYANHDLAVIGHDKWIEFSEKYIGEPVTKLGGMGGMVPDTQVVLEL